MINILDSYQAIGIVGLAKNTGKTTTLNYLINQYQHEVLGLTSIGLDGEPLDQVNFMPKPKIMVYPNMVVATAKECLTHSLAKIEIIQTTSLITALGPIMIGRVKEAGTIMLAGPTTNREMNHLLSMLKHYVKRIFVDGAFNRMTFSSIRELDGMVLATGAAFSPVMQETIDKTAFIVQLFSLRPSKQHYDIQGSMMINTDHQTYSSSIKSLGWFEKTLKTIKEPIRWIYVKGAITERLMHVMLETRVSGIRLLIDDPTKMLIHHSWMNQIKKMNVDIHVLKSIPLLWITMNPWSPDTKGYDESLFYHGLKDVIAIKIDNVKRLETS